MLRYTVGYSRVILLVWPTMLTCVQSLGSLCIYLWHMHIVHTTHTDTYREKKKKPTQHTHTHTETESQRFLSLFHLNIFIHSLFLTFSLSVCIVFVVAVVVRFDRCCLLLVLLFIPFAFLPPCTFNWYHCASGSRHQIWYSTIQSPGTCNGIGKQFKSYKYINIVYLYTTMQTHSRKHILRHCTCQKHIILKAISSCMAGGKLLLQVMGKGMLLHNFVVIM